MRECELFASVVEATGVNAAHGHAWIALGEFRGIAREDEELPRSQHRATGKCERNAARERESAQIQRVRARVLELEKLKLIAAHRACPGWIEHDLGDGERREILLNVKRRLHQRGPRRTIFHASTDDRMRVEHEWRGVGLRTG